MARIDRLDAFLRRPDRGHFKVNEESRAEETALLMATAFNNPSQGLLP